jgi:hypothetical protein
MKQKLHNKWKTYPILPIGERHIDRKLFALTPPTTPGRWHLFLRLPLLAASLHVLPPALPRLHFKLPLEIQILADRLEPLVILQLVGNDKLNRAAIGLDLNVHLRFQEVSRLLVDHLIQQSTKKTKFNAIYSNLPISEQPHASPHPYRMQYCRQSHPLHPSTKHLSPITLHLETSSSFISLIHSTQTIQKRPFSNTFYQQQQQESKPAKSSPNSQILTAGEHP